MLAAIACLAAGRAPDAAGHAEAVRIFAAGNDHYGSGEYEDAARYYRQLLNQGYRSAAVHYNLGNALFKMGRLGPAILQYEKAAVLAPADPDIAANLAYLRTLTADKASLAGAHTTTFFVERLLALTSLDQDAAAFTALYLLVGCLTGIRIASRSARLRRLAVRGIAAALLPLLLTGATFAVKLYRTATIVQGVVLQDRVDVRSGPGQDNTTLFTVHEGLKVRIRNEQGSWYQVSLDNGLNGWVPAVALGVI